MTEPTARVAVDPDVCGGCQLCLDACPTDVFRFLESEGYAYAAYADDCCACLLCVEDCPTEAITLDPRLTIRGFVSVYDQLSMEVTP